MTQPWTPAPNPGGRNREFIRKTVAAWIDSGNITGLGYIYPGTPPEGVLDENQPGSLYRSVLFVHAGDISEDRAASTGPADPGGKVAHYSIMLTLGHRCTSVQVADWWQAEDDHDRILDAVKDRFRGAGRDLGRPDVVLQAGDWPAQGSIHSETDPPIYNDGVRDQWSRIFLTVSQYMQRQP